MKRLIIILSLFVSTIAFAQKPKSGTYTFKFFDLEYGKFHGTCKVVVKGDSVTVYAIEDCHRKKGELINEGFLVKEKDGKWLLRHWDKKDEEYEEVPDRLSFTKKIFYTY